MMITAQVSVYPLNQQDINSPIERAIALLKDAGLMVDVSSMSTVVVGEAEVVFNTLRAIFTELGEQGQVVMTVTFSNACPLPEPPKM